jgi:hypothetical protein
MQFIQECFYLVNLPFTLALLLVLGYWGLAIVGGIGLDFLNLDSAGEIDGESLGITGLAKGVANFFYLGDIPVVIVGSLFVFLIWAVNLIGNHYLNADYSFWVLALTFLPNLMLSLLLTKVLLIPIRKLFPEERIGIDRDEYYHQVGRVITSEVNQQFGQIEILQDGPPIVFNVRCRPETRLKKGDAAKIIGYRKSDDTFLVELTKWEN